MIATKQLLSHWYHLSYQHRSAIPKMAWLFNKKAIPLASPNRAALLLLLLLRLLAADDAILFILRLIEDHLTVVKSALSITAASSWTKCLLCCVEAQARESVNGSIFAQCHGSLSIFKASFNFEMIPQCFFGVRKFRGLAIVTLYYLIGGAMCLSHIGALSTIAGIIWQHLSK